jgi:hypothetical protein
VSLKNYKIIEVSITTKNGKEILLNAGLLSNFLIREDIFSPYMTAEIDITDTDGLFYDKRTDINDNNGAYVSGGEKVNIIIETQSVGEIDTKKTKTEFYVDETTPIVTKSNKQSGTLRLVTKEAIVNECTRLVRRYNGTIEETVKKIILDDIDGLSCKKSYNKYLNPSDYKTLNNYSFIANIEKPFNVIRKLSVKAVPNVSKKVISLKLLVIFTLKTLMEFTL